MELKSMDNVKDDKYYAKKIIENIDAIEKYVKGINYDQFVQDGELVDAVMFRFVQLIENIGNISKEFKEKNNQIPWGSIMGFRNGIVHEYGKTDFLIVYETATNDLHDLRLIFENVV